MDLYSLFSSSFKSPKTPPPMTAPPPSSSLLMLSSFSASLCSPTIFTLRLFPILYIRPLSKLSMSSLPWPSSSSSLITSLSSSPLPLLSSLNSKVVSQYSSLLAPPAIDSVLSVIAPANPISSIFKISRLWRNSTVPWTIPSLWKALLSTRKWVTLPMDSLVWRMRKSPSFSSRFHRRRPISNRVLWFQIMCKWIGYWKKIGYVL